MIKILLVEDDQLAEMVAKFHFHELGCELDIAKSSDEALAKANAVEYTLIFMDIGLGLSDDGFSVTEKIKAHSKNKNTPVIALTAHGAIEYRRHAEALGMVEYVTKPIEKSHLVSLLAKYNIEVPLKS